jgi:hypothetical protein
MRRLFCCLLVVVAAALYGCSPALSGPRPSATVSTSVASAPSPARQQFCPVSLPAAWQDALSRGTIPRGPNESLVVKGSANDGSSLFAESTVGGWL